MASFRGNGAVVGIDLGTTYSVLAWVDAAGHVDAIPNGEGFATTPSVVFFEGSNIVVGREAVRAALIEPEKAAEGVKRDMGQPHYGKRVCGRQMRPEVLSAYILKKVREDAERRLGPISDAVITVPAYFDDARRKATQDAGKMAGLNVVGVINEPCAAALWYGYSQGAQVKKGAVFLVYDLGGGTFDATLMRALGPHDFQTIATDGDVMLGGRDWDQRLLDHVATEFMRTAGADPREDDGAYQELSLRVEEAKRALSARNAVSIPISHAGQRLRITVDRAKFEEITADLLARTQSSVELLLAEARMSWDQVDLTLVTGGASRMPTVMDMLSRLTGRQPNATLDPDLAVAKGAAVYAAALRAQHTGGPMPYHQAASQRLGQLRHRSVNSHSLGVEVENDETGRRENFAIIPRNSAIPCRKSETFGLSAPSSEAINGLRIDILEGDAKDPEACVRIGTCIIDDLPPGLPEGSPVEVTFAYSADGRIEVDAVATGIGRRANVRIDRPGGLTSQDVARHTSDVQAKNVL